MGHPLPWMVNTYSTDFFFLLRHVCQGEFEVSNGVYMDML